jgi:hypothetical protein
MPRLRAAETGCSRDVGAGAIRCVRHWPDRARSAPRVAVSAGWWPVGPARPIRRKEVMRPGRMYKTNARPCMFGDGAYTRAPPSPSGAYRLERPREPPPDLREPADLREPPVDLRDPPLALRDPPLFRAPPERPLLLLRLPPPDPPADLRDPPLLRAPAVPLREPLAALRPPREDLRDPPADLRDPEAFRLPEDDLREPAEALRPPALRDPPLPFREPADRELRPDLLEPPSRSEPPPPISASLSSSAPTFIVRSSSLSMTSSLP